MHSFKQKRVRKNSKKIPNYKEHRPVDLSNMPLQWVFWYATPSVTNKRNTLV